jgi:hypothetical protein
MIQNKSRTEYVSNLHATTSPKTVSDEKVLESQENSSNLQKKDDIEHSIAIVELARKVNPVNA